MSWPSTQPIGAGAIPCLLLRAYTPLYWQYYY
jgi:hypothetical protein